MKKKEEIDKERNSHALLSIEPYPDFARVIDVKYVKAQDMAGGSAQSSVQSSTVIKQKLSINISEVNYIISHDKKKLQPPYFFVATGENPLPNFIGNIIDKFIYLTY